MMMPMQLLLVRSELSWALPKKHPASLWAWLWCGQENLPAPTVILGTVTGSGISCFFQSSWLWSQWPHWESQLGDCFAVVPLLPVWLDPDGEVGGGWLLGILVVDLHGATEIYSIPHAVYHLREASGRGHWQFGVECQQYADSISTNLQGGCQSSGALTGSGWRSDDC